MTLGENSISYWQAEQSKVLLEASLFPVFFFPVVDGLVALDDDDDDDEALSAMERTSAFVV